MGFNDRRFIDLHIHSTASDGTLEPTEVIDHARAAGLSAISITDHDTTDGCKQVLARSSGTPPEFLTGVEISAAFPSGTTTTGSIHILGYDIDVHDTRLNRILADLRAARNDRSPRIIKRLKQIGFSLSPDDISPFARGGQVGRPHIAQAMLHKGYVASINEAFDKYIGKNGAAFVDKDRIECDTAIELISGAGGIPVLAHPGLIELPGKNDLESLLDTLINKGILGLEVQYPGHAEHQAAFFSKYARKHGLLETGGSDFHGDLNPEIQMGKGTGDLFVEYTVYQRLIEFKRKNFF